MVGGDQEEVVDKGPDEGGELGNYTEMGVVEGWELVKGSPQGGHLHSVGPTRNLHIQKGDL